MEKKLNYNHLWGFLGIHLLILEVQQDGNIKRDALTALLPRSNTFNYIDVWLNKGQRIAVWRPEAKHALLSIKQLAGPAGRDRLQATGRKGYQWLPGQRQYPHPSVECVFLTGLEASQAVEEAGRRYQKLVRAGS